MQMHFVVRGNDYNPEIVRDAGSGVTGSLVRQNDAYHVRRGINASCRHGRNDIEYFREKVWRPKHPGYSRRPTTGGPIQNQWLLRSLRSAARSPRDPR